MNNCDLYMFLATVIAWLRNLCRILVGKLSDKWPYFKGYDELSDDKIKLNYRKTPNHHHASLALKILMVVCIETLLKIVHLIHAMKSYRWDFRHGLFCIIIKIRVIFTVC